MKAEIISIGTELLLGEITDTNASYLASQLPLLGIDLLWVTQVGDNMDRLRECIERAWQRSDLIIATGGLGPTEDDLTREAIATVLGEELYVEPALERTLREFFARRNFPMPENNIKQATLIPSARAIPNHRGSAPGWWIEAQDTPSLEAGEAPAEGRRKRGALPRKGREFEGVPQIYKKPHIIITMPGPPAEMQRMWLDEVFPKLKEAVGGGVIVSRTIKTLTMTESGVAETLRSIIDSANPSLAVYAKTDGIHVRLTAKAKSDNEATAMIS
ncbi:MAG: molybdopterin-binding protein, partial [Chloroflexota bacterium]|nr:molybdopterin-binding protein [Chloroflexota bacterium]